MERVAQARQLVVQVLEAQREVGRISRVAVETMRQWGATRASGAVAVPRVEARQRVARGPIYRILASS